MLDLTEHSYYLGQFLCDEEPLSIIKEGMHEYTVQHSVFHQDLVTLYSIHDVRTWLQEHYKRIDVIDDPSFLFTKFEFK